MARRIIFAFAIFCLAAALPAHAAEDPVLRARADAYEQRLRQWHVPGVGGIVQVVYDAADLQNVSFYKGQGDSTFHTSMYLAAESFRYAATGDAVAKANAVAAVQTLETHLRVTQTAGYIARYVGPIDTPYMLDYIQSDLVRWGEGIYLGKFWLGDTSSDQYVSWFFGMGVAYDLIDDAPTKALISSMVQEVVDKLRTHSWLIMAENGLPSPSAPNIDGSERMAFLLVAANVIDDPFYEQLYVQEFEAGKAMFPFWSFSFFNKYTEYFAFNLKHLNHYSIFRYETDPDRRSFYLDYFSRDLVEWTHNAWFDFVWLTMIDSDPGADDVDAILADDLNTLTLFPDPPHRESHKDIPLLPIDPLSQTFVSIQDALGLQDLLGFELQTEQPHEIQNRCNVEFLWQRKPYHLYCVGFFDQHVFPGVDYLLAYWMGRYYGFVDPSPVDDDTTDDSVDDTASDDSAAGDDDSENPWHDDTGADDSAADDDAASADSGDDDDSGCGC